MTRRPPPTERRTTTAATTCPSPPAHATTEREGPIHSHDPAHRHRGLVVVIGAAAALGLGGLALEHRAHAHLNAALTPLAALLLPHGDVQSVDVTDSPALLASRRDRVRQVVVDGRVDDHEVMVIVHGYSRKAKRARSASWQVEGIDFAAGWTNVMADHGSYDDRARTTMDGHDYEVTASARPGGGRDAMTVVVGAAALTVDGAPLPLADAPAAVRRALRPVSFPATDWRVNAQVRSVWFDQQGAGVELVARGVALV